jgi:hypothetical protein
MQDASQETANLTIPKYRTKLQKPGLYLALFHGRHTPTAKMNGWGFNGPKIGPLRWFHTTYASDIRIEFEDIKDAAVHFKKEEFQFEMVVNDDMLVYDNMYFGDWTVSYVKPEDCNRPEDTFRETICANNLIDQQKLLC